jgi:hypothetical protein
MTLKKAVEIVEEYQKWRRGKRPYNSDIPVALPYTPAEIGEAEDCLISIAKDILKNYEANK